VIKATKLTIIATVVALSGYDVYAFVEGGVDSTISRVVYGWAVDYPIVGVAAGVLIGHLFWPQKIKEDKQC
jgi:uncharacterized membrane protein YuzA (DUF378 family)